MKWQCNSTKTFDHCNVFQLLCHTDYSFGFLVDLGASWLHGVSNENPLASVIGRLGLPLYQTSGDNSVIYDHDLERIYFPSKKNVKSRTENWPLTEVEVSHARRRLYESPDPARIDPKVPYTKPKRSSRGFNNGHQRETWRDVYSDPKRSFQSSLHNAAKLNTI